MLRLKDFIITLVAVLIIVVYSILTKQSMMESILSGVVILIVVPVGLFIKRKFANKN